MNPITFQTIGILLVCFHLSSVSGRPQDGGGVPTDPGQGQPTDPNQTTTPGRVTQPGQSTTTPHSAPQPAAGVTTTAPSAGAGHTTAAPGHVTPDPHSQQHPGGNSPTFDFQIPLPGSGNHDPSQNQQQHATLRFIPLGALLLSKFAGMQQAQHPPQG